MLIVRLRQTWRARSMEWLLAAGLLGWGLIVVQSPIAFTKPYFLPLARIAPGPVWGAAAILIGLMRLGALFVNGSMPKGTPILRQFGCGFGITIWSCMLFGALSQEWHAPGSAIYAMIFAMDTLSLSFAAADGRAAAHGRH